MIAIDIHANCLLASEAGACSAHRLWAGACPANNVVFLALADLTDTAQDMHSEQKFERYQFGLKMVWLLLPRWHASSVWKAWYTP